MILKIDHGSNGHFCVCAFVKQVYIPTVSISILILYCRPYLAPIVIMGQFLIVGTKELKIVFYAVVFDCLCCLTTQESEEFHLDRIGLVCKLKRKRDRIITTN